ncbi:MAG: hypothetical protein J6V49_02905, partial [Bacteroidales bacterium]|nr:hypothetical protein [Bacteroidales bacterium]
KVEDHEMHKNKYIFPLLFMQLAQTDRALSGTGIFVILYKWVLTFLCKSYILNIGAGRIDYHAEHGRAGPVTLYNCPFQSTTAARYAQPDETGQLLKTLLTMLKQVVKLHGLANADWSVCISDCLLCVSVLFPRERARTAQRRE